MGRKIEVELGFVDDLNETQTKLLNLLVQAHQTACTNNANASREICKYVTAASGGFTNGIAAAILSTGGSHAPIYQARLFYRTATKEFVAQSVSSNPKVRFPGFGNSFFKDGLDPAWSELSGFLDKEFPKESERLSVITSWISNSTGKKLFPNAAIFSGIACELCGFPDGSEPVIFLIARLPVWASYAGR